MLNQGLYLLAYGMGTVFVFLTMLVVITGFMSNVISRYLPETTTDPDIQPARPPAGTKQQLIAVIAAAIRQHRSRSNR